MNKTKTVRDILLYYKKVKPQTLTEELEAEDRALSDLCTLLKLPKIEDYDFDLYDRIAAKTILDDCNAILKTKLEQ